MSNLTTFLTGPSAGSAGFIGDVDNITIITADTSSPATVTILTSQIINGTLFIIKDKSGNAAINNVTINTQGSETIDGVASVNIIVDFGVVNLFVFEGNLLSW